MLNDQTYVWFRKIVLLLFSVNDSNEHIMISVRVQSTAVHHLIRPHSSSLNCVETLWTQCLAKLSRYKSYSFDLSVRKKYPCRLTRTEIQVSRGVNRQHIIQCLIFVLHGHSRTTYWRVIVQFFIFTCIVSTMVPGPKLPGVTDTYQSSFSRHHHIIAQGVIQSVLFRAIVPPYSLL